MRKFHYYFYPLFFLCALPLWSQFTQQDSLRGSITPERAWWDLTHYDLSVSVDPQNKSISGKNIITYRVIKPKQLLQIDLQKPLNITKITQNNQHLKYHRTGNVYFIEIPGEQLKGNTYSLTVFYEGKPREAKNAPWDGGFSWKKDQNGKDFIATSCQGLGASVWWPCKDHMYDEPDEGMDIRITTPKRLMDVSNGRLVNSFDNKDGSKTWHWKVVNPINNYGVNINIADYVHFGEVYNGEKGILTCDYYVLPYNLEKAEKQFKQVTLMLEAFEYWFGPYPFYEDGYKLVEVPYLGMEHQSSVTYGNRYMNGYLGGDLSGTGWGLKFDFIIIHESGHEWFANNITYKDIADMWIHEGFTTYSEVLYVDYHFGTKAGNEYMIGLRKGIRNDKPIIGPYGVNKSGSGDKYPKGAQIIHMVRQMVNDDTKFRNMLRSMNAEFYHQTVTTAQIENFIIEKTGLNLNGFFNQYLRTTKIPVLQYKIKNKQLIYRYANTVTNFLMPIKVWINGESRFINPGEKWKTLHTDEAIVNFKPDVNYYIKTENLLSPK